MLGFAQGVGQEKQLQCLSQSRREDRRAAQWLSSANCSILSCPVFLEQERDLKYQHHTFQGNLSFKHLTVKSFLFYSLTERSRGQKRGVGISNLFRAARLDLGAAGVSPASRSSAEIAVWRARDRPPPRQEDSGLVMEGWNEGNGERSPVLSLEPKSTGGHEWARGGAWGSRSLLEAGGICMCVSVCVCVCVCV